MREGWFTYDIENGFTFHDSETEAKNWAEATLRDYRSEAQSDDEWNDDVGMVCWGKVHQRAKETDGSTFEQTDYELAE